MRNLVSFALGGLLIAASGAALAQSPVANPDPAAVKAGSYALETHHARVNFEVDHMGFSDWYGDFSGITGSLRLDPRALASAHVEVSIPVASVSTTNTTLDGELRGAEWFDAAKYPTIRFVSTKVTPTGARTAMITGNLTFHGVTRPVVLKARFLASGVNPLDKKYTVGFDATTTIKRSDFGVKTYVPLIGDEVSLRISAPFELAN